MNYTIEVVVVERWDESEKNLWDGKTKKQSNFQLLMPLYDPRVLIKKTAVIFKIKVLMKDTKNFYKRHKN